MFEGVVSSRHIDLLISMLFVSCGFLVWLLFNLPPLLGTIALIVPTATFLLYRKKKSLKKLFVATFVIGCLSVYIVNALVVASGGWELQRILLPFFIGSVPLDEVIGFFLMAFFVFVFYEHFLNPNNTVLLSSRFRYVFVLSVIGVIGALGITVGQTYGVLPQFPYPYLVFGLISILLPIYYVFSHKQQRHRFFEVAIFFAVVWLLAEYAILYTEGIKFSGQYLYQVQFFSHRVPIEEIVFWICMYAPSLVVYYEFFADDQK